MNNSHIYPITCQAGRSYLELLLMRLRWAQLGLIQNLQALETVEKRRKRKGDLNFAKVNIPSIDFTFLPSFYRILL